MRTFDIALLECGHHVVNLAKKISSYDPGEVKKAYLLTSRSLVPQNEQENELQTCKRICLNRQPVKASKKKVKMIICYPTWD